MTKTTKQQEWEKEFDEFVYSFNRETPYPEFISSNAHALIKAFIKDLLAKQKAELLERVEKWSNKELDKRLEESIKTNDLNKSSLSGYAHGVISRMLEELKKG